VELYHFSEEPDIEVFVPRVVPTHFIPDRALVWAIDEWHAPMYFLPRDCPRACFWPGEQTSGADRERWFGGIDARMVMVVESGWLERIRATTVYRYTLPSASFELLDANAGHWVSTEPVTPVAIDPIDDLLAAIAGAGIELRITPRLLDLWSRVIESSLSFSGTRLRNAKK
jgi:hypothetical protein